MQPHPRLIYYILYYTDTISESLGVQARICIFIKLPKFCQSLFYGDDNQLSLQSHAAKSIGQLSAISDLFITPSFLKPLLYLTLAHCTFLIFFFLLHRLFFSQSILLNLSPFSDLQMLEGPGLGHGSSPFLCLYFPLIMSHDFNTSYELRTPKFLFPSLNLSTELQIRAFNYLVSISMGVCEISILNITWPKVK